MGAICNTGELTHTDYSDSTPDITTTYTRLGQKKTVTDATGTRTFAYSATILQPETESLDGTFFSSTNLLTRSRDALGRNDGYQLGTAADPDAVQWVDNNHDQ